MHGVQDARVDGSGLPRWAAGHDSLYPGHFRRDHRHDGRGQTGVAAGRHITAAGVYWNDALPHAHARADLSFKLSHAVFLSLGEGRDLLDGKIEFLHHIGRQLFNGRRGLGFIDTEGRRIVVVKFFFIIPDGRVAFSLDFGQDRFYGFLELTHIRFGYRNG